MTYFLKLYTQQINIQLYKMSRLNNYLMKSKSNILFNLLIKQNII